MSDETVTVRYEADTTRYAAGARRVSNDLDRLTAKAERATAAANRAALASQMATRRALGKASNLITPGFSDVIGETRSGAMAGALIAGYGVKKLIEGAREADPEMAKLGQSIASTVGPSARANETFLRLGNALSTLGQLVKNVFGTIVSGVITTLTAAAGTLATTWGAIASKLGLSKFGGRMSGAGEDLLSQALLDFGGSGRGGVLEMEKKLEEALERRKARDKAAKAADSGSAMTASSGFQGSAGLYVTSGAAMMASQSLNIQRSMLQELRSLTKETSGVKTAIENNAYGAN